MAKKQKKRTKRYTGVDAKQTSRPSVTRVTAVNRSKSGQWWHDNKRIVKPVLIAAAVVIALIWLVYELIRIASA